MRRLSRSDRYCDSVWWTGFVRRGAPVTTAKHLVKRLIVNGVGARRAPIELGESTGFDLNVAAED